jgi:hypothetical protein
VAVRRGPCLPRKRGHPLAGSRPGCSAFPVGTRQPDCELTSEDAKMPRCQDAKTAKAASQSGRAERRPRRLPRGRDSTHRSAPASPGRLGKPGVAATKKGTQTPHAYSVRWELWLQGRGREGGREGGVWRRRRRRRPRPNPTGIAGGCRRRRLCLRSARPSTWCISTADRGQIVRSLSLSHSHSHSLSLSLFLTEPLGESFLPPPRPPLPGLHSCLMLRGGTVWGGVGWSGLEWGGELSPLAGDDAVRATFTTFKERRRDQTMENPGRYCGERDSHGWRKEGKGTGSKWRDKEMLDEWPSK